MKLLHLMKNQSQQENLVYLVMWGMLFAAPLLSLYLRSATNSDTLFIWQEVFVVWQHFAIYLVLFLLHNFLLAPLLVHNHKRLYYFASVITITILFGIYQCANKPDVHKLDLEIAGQHMRPHKPIHDDKKFEHERPPFDEFGEGDFRDIDFHDDGMEQAIGHPTKHKKPKDMHRKHMPPVFIGEHDIVAVLVLILLFGANLGIKGYFRSRNDQKKLTELQKQNLEQQLEYLKYQINPHFFMNTLNNIHALVDIDPEKSKETIVELSKMMRFILYEGDKNGVPLSREFEFIHNYVTLMRLRYTDKVKITVDLPSECPDKTVPPLMLISFIENAFKHGISYQRDSFINIKAGIEGTKLRFLCRNSKADKPNQEKGGVGLQNVKQRLQLLYDNNFTLNIQDEPDIYNVELIIPLKSNSDNQQNSQV